MIISIKSSLYKEGGNGMKDKELRERLVKSMREDVVELAAPTTSSSIDDCIVKVMESYQNANKWLDTLKEDLLMNHGCIFFSNYVHNLAHTMPERFDKFGDILHTIGKIVPYPATQSIESNGAEINTIFESIFTILGAISESIAKFVECANSQGFRAAGISAEELLVDISKEYTNLIRMKTVYEKSDDLIKFDKWVAQYMNNINNLID